MKGKNNGNLFALSEKVKPYLPELSQATYRQLVTYITAMSKVANGLTLTNRDYARDVAYLWFITSHFLFSRDKRVDDILSSEVQEAIRIKESLFPYGAPLVVDCYDGRTLGNIVAGLQGGSFRTPAGDIEDALPTRDGSGSLRIPSGSGFGKFVLGAFAEGRTTRTIVFDSHIGCLRRGSREQEDAWSADPPPDGGLVADIYRKRQLAKAARALVNAKLGSGNTLKVIHISFNPKTGYCYKGLAQDDVLSHDAIRESGGYLTQDALNSLVADGKIMYTGEIVKHPAVRKLFGAHAFTLRYDTDYRQGKLSFWKAVEAMMPRLSAVIGQELKTVYPHLASAINADELRQREVLLVANAFTGFLHNQHEGYPYADHLECIVVVTLDEAGPFDRVQSLSVTPDASDLPGIVKFSRLNIIRANRVEGRLSDLHRPLITELYPVSSEFIDAPMPIVMFERLDEMPADFDAVQQAEFGDLPEQDWYGMEPEAFARYMEAKVPGLTSVTRRAAEGLRQRAIRLYRPGTAITRDLMQGRLQPLFVLADKNRKTVALLPFLMNGY